MRNIDRAEEIIGDLVDHPETPEVVSRSLADAGLLASDLPKPTESPETGNPEWADGQVQQDWGDVELHHRGYAEGENETTYSPRDARIIAYALLAAADYAEKEN